MKSPHETPLPPDGAALPETTITSRPGLHVAQLVRDLVEYRDLFTAFLRRDIKVRYRQTLLGVLWVVLQPVLSGGVFAAVFRYAGAFGEEDAARLFLYFLAGLVPWMAFASAVQHASMSLETNAALVGKVYFPRILIPSAFVAGSTVDFSVTFGVLVIAAWATGYLNAAMALWLVPLLAIQLLAALGIGAFFAILNAQYRDVKYAVPFLLMLGLFLTVLLPADAWPEGIRGVLALNPMLGVAEAWRAAVLGGAVDGALLATSAIMAVALALGGVLFFRWREARLVDVL